MLLRLSTCAIATATIYVGYTDKTRFYPVWLSTVHESDQTKWPGDSFGSALRIGIGRIFLMALKRE